jgi:hypothetical protein
VEEHKEGEMDLGRRSGGAGVVVGGPATEFCFGRWRSGLVMVAMSRHAGGRRGSVRWSRSFLEVMWSCWSDRREVGAAGRPSRRGGRSGGRGRSTVNVSGMV